MGYFYKAGRCWRLTVSKNGSPVDMNLGEVCSRFPLEKGLSELLAYLNIASKDGRAVIEEEAREVLSWRDEQGREKRAEVPRVIFIQRKAYEPA